MESDRHAIDAERLDRLVEVDLALLEVETLRLELRGDVRRRDGAKKFAFFADAREKHDFARLGELEHGQLPDVKRRLEAAEAAVGREVGSGAEKQPEKGLAPPPPETPPEKGVEPPPIPEGDLPPPRLTPDAVEARARAKRALEAYRARTNRLQPIAAQPTAPNLLPNIMGSPSPAQPAASAQPPTQTAVGGLTAPPAGRRDVWSLLMFSSR